ncbi:MAG: hypothetical protein HY721_26840 [Planctomycetes bacterium]|nr:hypothetical protein [Planctomycetota bacterium]
MSREPSRIVDGWVKLAGAATLEVCDNGVDDDGNGMADCDDLDCLSGPSCREKQVFLRADADGSGRLNVADAVRLVLFAGCREPSPGCL